jgi:hypothetical protein
MSGPDNERIDLAALDVARPAEEGRPLALKHPVTGAVLPGWVLRVRGYDAQTYQQVSDDHQRRRLERLSRRQTPTVEELNAEALELAASLVAGWEDRFDLDGAPLPYSGANAARLFRRFGWIRQQVEQFAGDRANFLPGSTSS